MKKSLSLFLVVTQLSAAVPIVAWADQLPPPPQPVPAQSDIDKARQAGLADGQNDGGVEGNARGPAAGAAQGAIDGYQAGFNSCQAQDRQASFDTGYKNGYNAGQSDGTQAGVEQGRAAGQTDGAHAGTADGRSRADQTAKQDSLSAGTQKGIQDADASDAASRGQSAGKAEGQTQAYQDAVNTDYPRGVQDYNGERFNEAVLNHDAFSQKQSRISAENKIFLLGREEQCVAKSDILNLDAANGVGSSPETTPDGAKPDYRNYHPHPAFAAQPEIDVYGAAYKGGYDHGFVIAYSSTYSAAATAAAAGSKDRGCQVANQQDYRGDLKRGIDEGRTKGYHDAFQSARDQAYRIAYDAAFRVASDAGYRESYNGFYSQHFEEARQAAFTDRQQANYNTSYQQAKQQSYNSHYPEDARHEYALGRQSEQQEFQKHPVRLVSVDAIQTSDSGLYEPGQAVRLHLQLRNFSTAGINAQDLKIKITSADSGVTVTDSEEALVRGLREKSVSDVSDALEFRLAESAANQSQSLVIAILYKGELVESKTIEVVPQFMVAASFAQDPALQEGIEQPILMRVTNQSKIPTGAKTSVNLKVDASQVDVSNPQQIIGALQPGESKVVEFRATARTNVTLQLPMALSILDNGRRIGLLELTKEIPIGNDYQINLTDALTEMRKAGLNRIHYEIKNVGSRLTYKSLTLKMTVLDSAGRADASVQILGPNPQYLSPTRDGETIDFVIPLMVSADNNGGTLVLSVEEEGRTVVVQRDRF